MEVSRGPDLGEVTTPELYQRNAFRLTGLPVDASARQVRRRADEAAAALRLGADLTAGDAWLPPHDAGADAVRDALHRLRDPVRRIVDELFWLWPGLGGDSLGEAALIWAEHVEADPPDPAARAIARHNRAVVAHLNALEWPESVPGGIAKRWRKAYENWRLVLDDDLCWRHLTDRVTALGDPRLRAGAVERLRSGLPGLLLGIHARLAVAAATEPPDAAVPLHGTLTARHVKAMRASGFPAAEVDNALVSAVEPHVARLRALGEQARSTAGQPEALRGAADTLLSASAVDWQVVREVLGAGHPVVTGVADALASRVRECVVREANALSRRGGDDPVPGMRGAVRRLDKARRLAAGPHVREEIDRDIGTVLSNVVIAQCAKALDGYAPHPASGLQRHRRLLDDTRESLRRLEKLGHDRLATVRDEVAGTAFEMVVGYANATGDATAALPALSTVRALASDAALRGQIDQALAALRTVEASSAPPLRPQPRYETAWQDSDPAEDEVLAAIRRLRQDALGSPPPRLHRDIHDDPHDDLRDAIYNAFRDVDSGAGPIRGLPSQCAVCGRAATGTLWGEPRCEWCRPEAVATTGTAVLLGCLLLMAGLAVLPAFPEWDWSMVRYPVSGLGLLAFFALCSAVRRWSRQNGRYGRW